MEREVFSPARWLPGRHLRTFVPSLMAAPRPDGLDEILDVSVGEGSAVRVLLNHPAGAARGTLLLVHGLGGSADSPYVRRTACLALARGWVVARMNLRNCGGTEALARTLYNGGQWNDVGRVLEDLDAAALPRPIAAAGFSLGGNLVLLFAGRAAEGSAADAVAGVNPPVDLDACCHALERPSNFPYQVHFSRLLCGQIRRVRSVRPLPGPEATFWRVRTVRRFDRFFTAPDAGYRSAEAYYAASSAGPHLTSVRVPALILSAADDPFVPVETFAPYRSAPGARLSFAHPAKGGHLGYWQSHEPRFWAGKAVLDFFEDVLRF